MTETIIKDLLTFKLKMIDSIAERLPKDLRSEIKRYLFELAEAVNKVTAEYLERNREERSENSIKSVIIE